MIFTGIFSGVIVLIYALLILGWYARLRSAMAGKQPVYSGSKVHVSVVVPFRNEAENLPNLLNDLARQQFPLEQTEVLLVNDHSRDSGAQIVKNFARSSSLNIRLLDNGNEHGKKAALEKAWWESRGEVILQTDADCRLPPHWVQNMTRFSGAGHLLRLGPVAMLPQRGFWSRFAALEFMSLQAVGAAAVAAQKPFMGSAANMAYRKSLLEKSSAGYDRVSGDDVFLIQQASREGQVDFETQAVVKTPAPASLGELLSQRARWGGKTPAYASGIAILTAALVAGLAVWQVFLLVFSFFHPPAIGWFVGVLLAKGIADYLLLSLFAKATGQNPLMRLFPLACLVYPFYILITGAVILFGSVSWKGRSFRPIVD